MNSARISISFFLVITFIIQQEPTTANNDASVRDQQLLCTSCVSYLTQIQDNRSELTSAATMPLVKEKLKNLMKTNCHLQSPAPLHVEYCLERAEAQLTEIIGLMNQMTADVKNGPLPRSVATPQKVCGFMGLCSIADMGCFLCEAVSQESRSAYQNALKGNSTIVDENGKVDMFLLFRNMCKCESRNVKNNSCSKCKFPLSEAYKGHCDANCTEMVTQHFQKFVNFSKTEDNVQAGKFCDELNVCSYNYKL